VCILSLNAVTSMKLFSIDVILPSSQGVHNQLMDMLVEVQSGQTVHSAEELSYAIMDMLKKVRENQAKHEEINKKMMSQCLTEENFRKKEISDAKSAYNASSAAFAKCQASLHAAQENLPSLKRALKDFQDNLQKKQDERNKQHKLYLERRKDWTEAIQFLNDFIHQVETKLAKYGSFADLGEKLLRHVSKLGRMSEAVEVFVAMASERELSAGSHNDYSYRAQTATVGNLKTHLRNLLNKLIVDSKQNDNDEAKAQAAFDKVKAELMVIIGKLQADIKKTKTQITNMNACVANEGKIMTAANSKLSRNGKLLDLAGKTCTDFTREFISATKNRLSEMNVITQILKIMKKRFGQLPEDMLEYLRSTKKGFRIYVNSTQFKRYQEYVQQHVADSIRGKHLADWAPKAKPAAVAEKAVVKLGGKPPLF